MIVATTYIITVIAAVGVDELLNAGRSVGTASNQVILGILVVALIGVVLYRERQQNKQHAQQLQANALATEKAELAIRTAETKHDDAVIRAERERVELYAKMEKQHAEMNEERRQRWTMMIDVVRDNTVAFRGVRETLDSLQRYLLDNKPSKA